MTQVSAGWVELIKQVSGVLENSVSMPSTIVALQASQSVVHHISSLMAEQAFKIVMEKQASPIGGDEMDSLISKATLQTSPIMAEQSLSSVG